MKSSQKIIAAFYWNRTNKTISFMLIDSHFYILVNPQQFHLKSLPFRTFKQTADVAIHRFFQEILHVTSHYKNCTVKIEYKIVHLVAHDIRHLYQPNAQSIYLLEKFLAQYASYHSAIPHLRLCPQLRKNLRKPALDIFKQNLRKMHLVQRKRNNGYQFNLWMLALHATQKNYKACIEKLKTYFPFPHKSKVKFVKRLH